ncbi:MAG: hypothetical protein ACE360_00580 [Hyphomicrobiales bacterium]
MADFNEISAAQREMDRAQAVHDLNNEMAGREVGRISRFLTRNDESGLSDGKRGHKGTDGLSALDIMLATSPEYFALHTDLSGDLRGAQDRNHELAERLDAAIIAAQSRVDGIMDQAVLLPSGERAFLDDEGTAWTNDDRRVDPSITEGIDWTGHPTRAAYLEARETLTDLQEVQDENRRIGVRLGEIDNAIHDEDSPATMDELRDFHDDVEAIEGQMDELETQLDARWSTEHAVEPDQPTLAGVSASAVPVL